MYNSVDNCCIFNTYRQLNRQLIQCVICLVVYMVFNRSLDTRNYDDLLWIGWL
jgi:hypothetical protein